MKLHSQRRFWRMFFRTVKDATLRPRTREWAKGFVLLWSANVVLTALIFGMHIYLQDFDWSIAIVGVSATLNVTMLYFSICGWFWRKEQDEFEALVGR